MIELLFCVYASVFCILAAWVALAIYRERASISQDEIDAEVRRILIEHPDDPVGYAAGVVERLQWSKNGRRVTKAELVLKELRRMP